MKIIIKLLVLTVICVDMGSFIQCTDTLTGQSVIVAKEVH